MPENPANSLDGMNKALCGNTQSQFVTAAYCHLDSTTRQLRYSAAGHPPMLLARDGVVSEIEENGLMLAAFDFATYADIAVPLQRGDRVVLYTDGIIEAADASDEFFGRARLAEVIAQSAALNAGEVADKILPPCGIGPCDKTTISPSSFVTSCNDACEVDR